MTSSARRSSNCVPALGLMQGKGDLLISVAGSLHRQAGPGGSPTPWLIIVPAAQASCEEDVTLRLCAA